MKYRNLIKGQIYTITFRRRVFRGSYDCRYFNKEINQWIYVFHSLDKLITYTLPALETKTHIL